ncbi:MAG: hypothetical protein AB8B85_01310 [Paracoccaceae bacterium]
MTNTIKTAPAEIAETQLEDISGGPHWTTWDPPTYLTGAEVETATRGAQDATIRKWDMGSIEG